MIGCEAAERCKSVVLRTFGVRRSRRVGGREAGRDVVSSMRQSMPPINHSWAAMGRSLGTSSSPMEDATITMLLAQLRNRVVLMIGDSSLRNQFVQLARIGLAFDRNAPVADAIVHGAHRGSFSLPWPIKQPEKPDSSNGFWGGFPWMVATTPQNVTLVYAKVWGCAELGSIVRKTRAVLLRHRQRSNELGGWPPHLVLWNFGLHLLHVYPARPVPTVALRCALRYEALVHESTRELRAVLPQAHLVYRTTNAVCDKRFDGAWELAMRAHHCAASYSVDEAAPRPLANACRSERLLRVQEGCRRRYNITLAECVATFMDEGNSRTQRAKAISATSSHPALVKLFDAFSITDGRCDATVDGRHYPRLLATINARFLTLAVAEVGETERT